MTVAPVDAATVILVREGTPVGAPWQVYMVRRHARSEFAADVFVFPGGKVDAADRAPELTRYSQFHPGTLDHPEPANTWRALKLAAVRELFEEAGVLLATDENGAALKTEGREEHYRRLRQRLHAGELTLLALAEHERVKYALDQVHPFARWITPEGLPRRYDTRFFLAQLPHGQQPAHDQIETTAGVWLAPAEALERADRGEFPLVFPTRRNLMRMAGFHSIDQMIAAAGEADLRPIMPRMVEHGGQRSFLLPGDEGYGG